MKKALPLVLVAAITFLAVWLVVRDDDESPETVGAGGGKSLETTSDRQERPDVRREGGPGRAGLANGDAPRPLPGKTGDGKLVVRTTVDGRKESRGLTLVVFPDVGSVGRTDDGFDLTELPAGGYQITVHGNDTVPVTQRGILVKDGATTEVDIALVQGIQPRGRVLHSVSKEPIAGATVKFGDHVSVTSDEDGRFEVKRLVPKTALRFIDVTCTGFDTQRYRDQLFTDIHDMEMYLGGGTSTLVCKVVNKTGIPLPEKMQAKLGIEPIWETRRVKEVGGLTTFRFENLYRAVYRVELLFPGGEFPTIFRRIETTRHDTVEVELELTEGATFKGRLVGPEAILAGGETTVQLRSIRPSEVIASSAVDADGNYTLRNVPDGVFVVYVKLGTGGFHLPRIEIPENAAEVVKDIDLLRHRFLDRK